MDVLHPISEERGRPLMGPVFLNRFGNPIRTRKAKIPGGNPITSTPPPASAGIEDFTVHD
ncbi:hypothetical protein M527_13725 [Sphingobium indicum IP26]|nr:hypothetical protein M527_13725 [Sphingobium indicum IP26]